MSWVEDAAKDAAGYLKKYATGQAGPRNPPNTFVRTSHALSIRAKGLTVGMIQSWNPSMGRGVTPCFEVNVAGDGTPVEKVPGVLNSLTIQVSRYDLYKKRMEAAFGTVDFELISNQADPIQILELWRHPDSTMEGWLYVGCWFSNIGRTYSATDNRVVQVNATLEFTRKYRSI
jgi:hypothetical protein